MDDGCSCSKCDYIFRRGEQRRRDVRAVEDNAAEDSAFVEEREAPADKGRRAARREARRERRG